MRAFCLPKSHVNCIYNSTLTPCFWKDPTECEKIKNTSVSFEHVLETSHNILFQQPYCVFRLATTPAKLCRIP